MSDYYYNNVAADSDLANTANWWLDSGFTEAAGALPTTLDTAYVTVDANSNSGGACNPGALFITGGTFTATINVAGNVTVTAALGFGASITADGAMSFSTGASASAATLSAQALTFDGISPNGCTITGACVFSGAVSLGVGNSITGDVQFDDTCENSGGTINGNVTFTGAGVNSSTINGDCTFQDPGGSNSTGTVSGLLTIPGTLSGSTVTPSIDHSNTGNSYGSLAIFLDSVPSGGSAGPAGRSHFRAPLPFAI